MVFLFFISKLAGKYLRWSPLLKSCDFSKKRLQHRCFPVNSTSFLRTSIFTTSTNGCFYLFLIGKTDTIYKYICDTNTANFSNSLSNREGGI